MPRDARAEGTPVSKSSESENPVPKNATASEMPSDVPAKGYSDPLSAPEVVQNQVPKDADTEGTSGFELNSMHSSSSKRKNSYYVPRNPIFSPATHKSSSINVGKSFSVLDKEVNETSKNKFVHQKRTRKQSLKAKESKAQGTKGLCDEYDAAT